MKPSPTDRRAAILQAATQLIVKKGLSGVRTRDVTTRAGVGIGLLNHYFRWGALRAEAAVAALNGEIARLLGDESARPGDRLRAFVSQAFTENTATLWKLWIEITDAAIEDEDMSAAMTDCARRLHQRLADILTSGASAGHWSCDDAQGSAMRLLALHDGLAGFVLTGLPPLSRAEAASHLRRVVLHECKGFDLGTAERDEA